MKKRCLTLLLILAMCLTMLPVTAMAASGTDDVKVIRLLNGTITKKDLYAAFGGGKSQYTTNYRYSLDDVIAWKRVDDKENDSKEEAENLQDGKLYQLQRMQYKTLSLDALNPAWKSFGTFKFQTYYKIGVNTTDIPNGGNVSVSGGTYKSGIYEVNKDETLTLTFTPVDGYAVQVKTGDGAWITMTGNTYTHTATSSTTLSVRYVDENTSGQHKLTITVNDPLLGYYSGIESDRVADGDTVTLTAIPYNASTTPKNNQYAYVKSVKVNGTELNDGTYDETKYTVSFDVTADTTVEIIFAPRLVLKTPSEGPHQKYDGDTPILMYTAKMNMDKVVRSQYTSIEASILESTVNKAETPDWEQISIELKGSVMDNDAYHPMKEEVNVLYVPFYGWTTANWGEYTFHNDDDKWEEIRLVIEASEDGKYPKVQTEDLTVWILEARPELTIGGTTSTVTVTSADTMEEEINAAVLAKILADNTGATAEKLGNDITYSCTALDYSSLKNSTEDVEVSVIVNVNKNNYFLASSGTITVPVALADASCTAPTANDLTYNGSAQALVTAGTATGGTMQYKLDDGEWTATVPTATDAGTYEVYYKVVGDDDHNDFTPDAPISVTIAAKDIAAAEITLGSTSLPYTGVEQSVTITSVTIDGLTVTYNVTGNTGTDADDYTLTFTGTGNFTGTATADWVITKAALTVTAANKTIYIGQRAPEYSFTLSGLLDGHTASGITVQCPTAQLFRVGTYPITVELSQLTITDALENDVTANYTAEAVSGTLTVKRWPSSGNSSTTPDPEETPSDDTHDCPSLDYSDLNPELWYHKAVDYVLDNELMNGVGGNRFDPYGTTSRAMIVTILWRLEGCPKAVSAPAFTDVPDGMWYTEAIRWAASTGIVKGYGDQTFGLNDPITREQLATILYRYEQYKHGAAGALAFLPDFADRTEISDWAYEAMCWAVENGVIKGRESGLLDPKGRAMRCETAQMLMNDLAE